MLYIRKVYQDTPRRSRLRRAYLAWREFGVAGHAGRVGPGEWTVKAMPGRCQARSWFLRECLFERGDVNGLLFRINL
jgi:hypothetical protein